MLSVQMYRLFVGRAEELYSFRIVLYMGRYPCTLADLFSSQPEFLSINMESALEYSSG